MSDDTDTLIEAFRLLRTLSITDAHPVIDLLERRLMTAELRIAMLEAAREPDTHSRRVDHLSALDGYDISDPKHPGYHDRMSNVYDMRPGK